MKTLLRALGWILVGMMILVGIATKELPPYLIAGVLAVCLIAFGKKPGEKSASAPADDAPLPARPKAAPRYMSATEFLKATPTCYVAFDLETTGLSPQQDAIIEIGAVFVDHGQIVRSFSQLVNPEMPIPEAATNVNHITDKMVKHAPKIGQALREFMAFYQGAPVLAAHNASFDAGFLLAAAAQEGIGIAPLFLDTLGLSRLVWPELADHKLGSVAAAIGYVPEDTHRGNADAKAVSAIVQAALRDHPKIEAKKAEQRAQEKKQREQEMLSSIRITATDRAMFADRCPISDVRPADDYVSVKIGMECWEQGNALKRINQLEDALLLYNKARYYGYDSPALYESYAIIFRKLGRLQDEVAILDECLARNPNLKNEKIAARRDRAAELLAKA